MEIFNRLGQWSEIQKVRPVEEPPEVAAGRDGELVLRELVGSSYRLEDASVFAGRRIPSRRQARRRVGVAPGDTVMFHAVGEKEPVARRLVELEQIVLG